MRTVRTTNFGAASDTRVDTTAIQILAEEYAGNAARFYEGLGYNPTSRDYYMAVWSFGREGEDKLKESRKGLVLPVDLDDLEIGYEVVNLKVGDSAALAEWITAQLAADRIWCAPAYCGGVAERRPLPTRHAQAEFRRMLHCLSVKVFGRGWYALKYDPARSLVLKTPIVASIYDPLGQFPLITFGPAERDFIDKANEQLCGRGQEHLVPLVLEALEGPDGIFVHDDDFESAEEWAAHLHARLQEQSSSSGGAP